MSRETHVTWHEHSVSRSEREGLAGHRGCVVWFTGLSGCGKSTIANLVDRGLYERKVRSFILDGDNIRHGLNASPAMLIDDHGEAYADRFGLGFTSMDREENIRRIGSVAQLFCSAGVIGLAAFVSPYRRDRDAVRRHVVSRGRADDFVEVYVSAPLSVCEQRDPKGLYQKARAGEIRHFTGIDDPYEPPLHPELVLKSADQPAPQNALQVISYLESMGKISRT
jgi:adenylylsulfate kinase